MNCRTACRSLLIGLTLLLPAALLAQTTPYLIWSSPDPVPFRTPLSPVQLNAIALAGPPVPVPFASAYNILGISSDGVPYYTGGYDGSSWAFSSELLGNSVTWQGISFPLGPANAPDAVYGVTIPVPSGKFASLRLLGSLVNNAQPPTAQFLLRYTDGSSTVITQEMSDWVNPRNYPGESAAKCMVSRHNYDGTMDLNSVCVYGYALAVDPARTLASVTLPSTRNVVLLSAVMVPPVVPGVFTYLPAAGAVPSSGTMSLGTSFAPASPALYNPVSGVNSLVVHPASPRITPSLAWPVPAPILPGDALSAAQLDASASTPLGPVLIPLGSCYRVNAFYPDGARYEERGFDGSSTAFSSTALGSSLGFAGFVFPIGPPSLPDAATAATVALPAGSFSTLYLLGAAGTAAEIAQPFIITYADGSSTTASLNLSSWRSPQNFAGETIVASTTSANLANGQQIAGSFSVYGYQIPVDPARIPVSLTLPPSTDVLILAAGLGTGTSFPVAGSFIYTPPSGTVIQSFTTLNTVFSPSDTADFVPAQLSVPLVVGDLDFTLSAPNGTTLTATTGQSASLDFLLAPTNGRYSGPLTVTLQGTLPPLGTYTLTPSTIANSAGSTIITLAIQTHLLTGSVSRERILGATAASALCLLLFVPLLPSRRRRLPAALLLTVALAFLPAGCGSGYHDHVYPLTLVVTDGHFTHTLPVTLHILGSAQ